MKISIKNLILAVVAIIGVATISSCNRGVGCPNNFSMESPVVHIVKTIATNILK